MRRSKAIITTKMKLARVSKPSQLAKDCKGPGKIAMIIKMIGSKSQVMELRIDKLFLASPIIIMINNIVAAIAISIWRLVIFNPPDFNNYY